MEFSESPPPRIYGWRARLAWRLLRLGCHHPEGVVCEHRHYDYDQWMDGWHEGYKMGASGVVVTFDGPQTLEARHGR